MSLPPNLDRMEAKALKHLLLSVHPDKGGDPDAFRRVFASYKRAEKREKVSTSSHQSEVPDDEISRRFAAMFKKYCSTESEATTEGSKSSSESNYLWNV